MDRLSTVEDLMSIRKGNRRHVIVVVTQIIRVSAGEKFRFLTCAVRDKDGNFKQFSIKCFSPYIDIVADLQGGDIVSFTKLWKKFERRQSGSFRLGANDLDLEFHVWKDVTAQIIDSPAGNGPITDYSMIVGPLNHVKIAGTIIEDPQANGVNFVIVVQDQKGNLAEVFIEENINALIGEIWHFDGNALIEDGMIVFNSTNAHLEA